MDTSSQSAGSSAQLPNDVVYELYQVIEQQARHFHLETPLSDAVQDMWGELIRISDRLGTSLLDRYNPSRATLAGYVGMVAYSRFKKLYNKERSQRRTVQAYHAQRLADSDAPLVHRPRSGSTTSVSYAQRSGGPHWMAAVSTEYEAYLTDDSTSQAISNRLAEFDIERLFVALRGTRHARVTRRAANGEGGLSNLEVLKCVLIEHLEIREIASRYNVSVSEIRRRVRQLRDEPLIRRFKSDMVMHGR